MMKKLLCILTSGVLFSALTAHAASPGLEQIMADPDWIGLPPEKPWWGDQGDSVYYWQKRRGETIRDLYRIALSDGKTTPVDLEQAPADSGRGRVYAPGRDAAVWVSEGDIYLKDLDSASVRRITASDSEERAPLFSADGEQVFFLRDDQYYAYDRNTGTLTQLTDVRATDDPRQAPEFDVLRAHQLRNFHTLAEQERRQDRMAREQEQRSRRVLPVYLGKEWRIVQRRLSPSGRYLALVTEPREAEKDRQGSMPNYVNADGYVSVTTVRTRVGRNTQPAQHLLLVDLSSGRAQEIPLSALPGRDADPLAALRRDALQWHTERGADPASVSEQLQAPELRPLSVEALNWSPDGRHLAAQLLANDFKDRWLVSLRPGDGNAAVTVQDHLHDPAWINWEHNEFGWLDDSKGLWFLSEASGYSHLYVKGLDEARARQLTRGDFVVQDPVIGPRGRYAWLVANRAHPGNHQIFRVPLAGGELQRVSGLDGVSSFRLGPQGRQLLVSRSWIDRHPELYVGTSDGSGELRQLTDTVSAAYKAVDWTIPEIVQVPSSHSDRPIYAKLYRPADHDPDASYPAVMFVHGAGYTQNAHMGWPYYFREFMFHTLLTEAGYVVLDLDYRGSEGYGRDWRTTIYRQMGHPELEDYLDGIDYLVNTQGVDRDRVGIYGGSYGGFMTFMALFRAPEAFAAGAALRPVADWMHYENDYTRRILNTPLVDPVAYARSSPINHAEGLQAPLLIAAGMQDDNVFFQDAVLMVQRLLELKKPDFEIAIYPLDGHSFSHPESWLDEYRRIFRLMQDNLQ